MLSRNASGSMSSARSNLIQSSNSDVEGFFLMVDVADEKRLHRLLQQAFFDIREMPVIFPSCLRPGTECSGKATPEKRIGQFLLVVNVMITTGRFTAFTVSFVS